MMLSLIILLVALCDIVAGLALRHFRLAPRSALPPTVALRALSLAAQPANDLRWLSVRVPCTLIACLRQNGEHRNALLAEHLRDLDPTPVCPRGRSSIVCCC